MEENIDLTIATGLSAKSTVWKNKKTNWAKFVSRLRDVQITKETHAEYLKASKEDQTKIKDVGGYVGGYLRNGKRGISNVVNRQIITLDIDFAHLGFWGDYCLLYNNAAVIHSTHKHIETSPRFRLLLPLDREVTPDEYVAISRKIAGELGIDLFDNTTFEINRLMFWPSVPRDVEYYFEEQHGPAVNADEVLASYIDWRDSALWPTAEREFERVKNFAAKQEDPQQKKGIVGAFCRALTITEAMDKYLKGVYIPGTEDRYTYSEGTTSGGLIIYDDLFSYSHHGTDPVSGKLCNAFDLVRIHLFGHLDEGLKVSEKSKSFIKMAELAQEDKAVRKIIAGEKMKEAVYDFATEMETEADDVDWMVDLEVDNRGNYSPSSHNLKLILDHDPRLKGVFNQNLFDNKKYAVKTLPWRKVQGAEPIKNVDFSGVRVYIESIYKIVNSNKIDDAMALNFEKMAYHPIKEYFSKLVWDGIPRIDTLLVDFFGTPDTVYYREAIRKPLAAAVTRVYEPGAKFDLVLTLIGEQGTGKSTFFKRLGRQWFSDTFLSVQGKEALEQIQGAWIIEIAELAGLRKAEVEAVKHFISKQEDTFRPAYARTSETYKRQCIFVGTTNNRDFLTDPTGNRRFLPVEIFSLFATKCVFDDLTPEFVDQVWAEAVHLYKKKEKLYMSAEAETMATINQKLHSETDERSGIIENFLNMDLPEQWDRMDLMQRRLYLEDPKDVKAKSYFKRERVCIAEIWSECLGKPKEDMTRYNTREVNAIMRGLDGWEGFSSTHNFPVYGKQKFYERRK